MNVANATRKTVLAGDVELAKSVLSKTLGLMFRKGLGRSRGLLMEFSREGQGLYSIWMLCMRFPIDVVFINSEGTVTDVFERVPPVSFDPKTWKIYKPTRPVKWILEVPAGTVKRTRTVPGDRLCFE